MNRDDVLRIAKQAGMAGIATTVVCEIPQLHRFADLVIEAECKKQHDKLLAEFGAYKEGSEEAFGVVLGQKKSAEARLAQMQQTISAQQSVICNMREKINAKGSA